MELVDGPTLADRIAQGPVPLAEALPIARQIWRVSSDGGKPEHLVNVEAGEVANAPQLLPGASAVLFTLTRVGDWDTAQIVVQSLDTGKRHVVLERGTDARYVPTGHLVYALDGTLLAVPFDVTTLGLKGGAVPLLEDVAQQNVTAQFALSSQGALAYVPADALGRGPGERTLVWIDRQGHEDPLNTPPRATSIREYHPMGPASHSTSEIRNTTSGSGTWHVKRSHV